MNEVITTLLKKLEEALGGAYMKYYYGEVRVPAHMTFPFLEVVPVSSSITNRGTGGMTSNEFRIMVTIKTTMKKYIASLPEDRIKHTQDLVKRMEERDSAGAFKSGTIMGVLHDNLKLVLSSVRYGDIMGDWEIRYDESDLGESFILFATVSFSVKVIH